MLKLFLFPKSEFASSRERRLVFEIDKGDKDEPKTFGAVTQRELRDQLLETSDCSISDPEIESPSEPKIGELEEENKRLKEENEELKKLVSVLEKYKKENQERCRQLEILRRDQNLGEDSRRRFLDPASPDY